jgi:hypothetical protein
MSPVGHNPLVGFFCLTSIRANKILVSIPVINPRCDKQVSFTKLSEEKHEDSPEAGEGVDAP